MPYTAQKPELAETADQLRERIPGWGSDVDPNDRPSVPQERTETTGAHWTLPERQPGSANRERSIEHIGMPAAFGDTIPLSGLSGKVRRLAYERFSEARAAHWLLLLTGDRIDVAESRVKALVQGQPDEPFAETGIRAELRGHGFRSRTGARRADVKHAWLDPVVTAGPTLLAVGAVVLVARALLRRA